MTITAADAGGAVADQTLALLERWRRRLALSPREHSRLGPHLRLVDRQLQRLARRRPRLVVFGRVGVGKSSVLNALLPSPCFA
ncbi:MAG: GTPase, partial [Synechococcus sp. SB0676_bin_10]|nr:GTPase [Synechococcus sp. SB0676_bin_10]